MADYRATLAEIFGRSAAGIKFDLDTMRALIAALDHPERDIPHIVSVAGTNGKGSTASLLAHALSAGGVRTGLFTSPHLLSFGERIWIEGAAISQEAVVRHHARIARVEAACPRPPTFFEIATAMALLEMAVQRVEVAVLEVGLGGRLDATNVQGKRLCVVTPIALDHTGILGNTLQQIAGEKAGVFEPEVPCVIAPQHPDAMRALTQRANALRAPIATAEPTAGHARLLPANTPPYQHVNVATAISALEQLAQTGVSFDRSAATAAWKQWLHQGRYQWIEGQPDVLVDGAHNPAALRALGEAIAGDARLQNRPLHLVFSVLRDRDPADAYAALGLEPSTTDTCPLAVRRSHTPEALGTGLPNARLGKDCPSALDAATTSARSSGGVVVVTGSLYLAAEALGVLTSAPRDPPVYG